MYKVKVIGNDKWLEQGGYSVGGMFSHYITTDEKSAGLWDKDTAVKIALEYTTTYHLQFETVEN